MKILVISSRHPRDASGGAELQAYLIAKSLYVFDKNTIFCTVQSNCDLDTSGEDGLHYISFNGDHNIFVRAKKSYKLLKKFRPDIVYVRYLESFWWIYPISKLLKIPILYHVSSTMRCRYLPWRQYLDEGKKENWLWFLKKMLTVNFHIFFSRFADLIICQTEDQFKMMKHELNRTAKIVRSGLPVPATQPKKSNNQFSVIWIGKHWKNPQIFVDLAKRFANDADINFIMVGIFPFESGLRFKQIENQILNFKFMGKLDNDEVNKLLEKCHILVNTSDYEGFSNTFIEAWMRGVPVISLKLNPDNLLTEKRIGFCSNTIDQLEKDVRTLYQKRELYQEYSQNAREYALNNHDIEKTAVEIRKLAKEISKKAQSINNL